MINDVTSERGKHGDIRGYSTRRSIRQFEERSIPDGIITELLIAAMSAPSAGNQQPWHFVIIDDRQVLEKVPKLNPMPAWLGRPAWPFSSAGI